MPRTIVSFHAHPDDEALLTAGTLARAAAQGHRVVLVCATAGDAGLAAASFGSGQQLARARVAELHRSARAIGAARVEVFGYADSGLDGQAQADPAAPGRARSTFVQADLDVAAAELAAILQAERADVLTSYDETGGYGHPDHVQVHRVGRRAAELAGTPVLLEATVDRDLLLRALHLVRRVYPLPPEFDLASFERAYTPRDLITHRVDVRAHIVAKRVAMRAHASQTSADGGDRTLAALLRLPRPLYRAALGHEWFIEVGRTPTRRKLDDVFAGLDPSRHPEPDPARRAPA